MWNNLVRDNAQENTIIIMAGNKLDQAVLYFKQNK